MDSVARSLPSLRNRLSNLQASSKIIVAGSWSGVLTVVLQFEKQKFGRSWKLVVVLGIKDCETVDFFGGGRFLHFFYDFEQIPLHLQTATALRVFSMDSGVLSKLTRLREILHTGVAAAVSAVLLQVKNLGSLIRDSI